MSTKRKNRSARSAWSILDGIVDFVGKCCPEGMFMCCKVCCEFDEEGCGFGLVKMRRPFWYSYFCDHLRSACYKTNCVQKSCYETENAKQSANNKPPQKN